MIAIGYLESRLESVDEAIASAECSRDHFAGEALRLSAKRAEIVDELIQIRTAFDA